MILLKNKTVLTIVFIAQLVKWHDNFLLFPWVGKMVQKKKYFIKRISKEPTGLTWNLFQPKVSSGIFPPSEPYQNSSPAHTQTLLVSTFRPILIRLCRNVSCSGGPLGLQVPQSSPVNIHYILSGYNMVCRGDPVSRSKIRQRVKQYPTTLTTTPLLLVENSIWIYKCQWKNKIIIFP